MDATEHSDAWGRSSPTLWCVWEDYWIQDGFIDVAVEGDSPGERFLNSQNMTKDLYFPINRPELPSEFAKIASGEERDILDFVKTYGLLGYDGVMRTTLRSDSLVVDMPDTPESLLGKGDPVVWVLAHARNVRLALDLAARLGDTPHLEVFLQGLIREGPEGKRIYFEMIRRNDRWPMIGWPISKHSSQDHAYFIIEHILNWNTSGTVFKVMAAENADGETTLTRYLNPYTLLDVVYLHLADSIVGGMVRICEYCKRPFVPPNRKYKFCPPKKDNDGVSPCMNRAKNARHRQRHKKG